MVWKLSTLLLLSLRALNAVADAAAEPVDDAIVQPVTPKLAVSVSAKFPQSEIFGVKLINGHATQAVLDITNKESEPIGVAFVAGSLIQDAAPESQILRNLTARPYQIEIPAGESETVTYTFSTEMHPQDVRLQLVAVLKDHKNAIYTVSAYNGTVSVVEAPTSIFDPQIIFLYLVLLGAFAGTVYFIYSTWISTLFPQQKRGGRGGERAKRPAGGSKKAEPADQIPVVGADGPAVTSGAKTYDESWIPATHLQRPEAKRVRSGTPRTKVVKS